MGSVGSKDEGFWRTLLGRILEQPNAYWSGSTSARAIQVATNGSHRPVTQEPLTPEWIAKFRELPCLTDTWGQLRQPAELFRRTPETEPLRDVEPFVNAERDTEATKPLLILLGVRDKPTGPERLLERLQALAGNSPSPLARGSKVVPLSRPAISTGVLQKKLTQSRRRSPTKGLILTEQETWASTEEVFLSTDEDGVPGTVLIHPSLQDAFHLAQDWSP